MVLDATLGAAEAAQLLASRGVPPVGSRKSLVGLSPSVVELAPESEIAIAGSSQFTPKPVRGKTERRIPAHHQPQARRPTAGSLGSKKQLTWSQTVEGGLGVWEGTQDGEEDGLHGDAPQPSLWEDGGISLFFGDAGGGHAGRRLGSEAGARQRGGRGPKKQGGGLKPLEVGGGGGAGTLGGKSRAGGKAVGEGLVGEHFGSPKKPGQGRAAAAQGGKQGHAGHDEHRAASGWAKEERGRAGARGGASERGSEEGGSLSVANQEQSGEEAEKDFVFPLMLLDALANEDMVYDAGSFRVVFDAGPNQPNFLSNEDDDGGTPSDTAPSEGRQVASSGNARSEGTQGTPSDKARSEGRHEIRSAHAPSELAPDDARGESRQGAASGSSRGEGRRGTSSEKARSSEGRQDTGSEMSRSQASQRRPGSRQMPATSWRDVMAGTAMTTEESSLAKQRQAASAVPGPGAAKRRTEGPRPVQAQRSEGSVGGQGDKGLSISGQRQRTRGAASSGQDTRTASRQRSSGSARRQETGGSSGARGSNTAGSDRPKGTPGPGILRTPSNRGREAERTGSRGSSRGEGRGTPPTPHAQRTPTARTPTDFPGGGRPRTGRSSTSRSASRQGGASSRASSRSGGEEHPQSVSFLDLERRWGMGVNSRQDDMLRTERAKYLIKNRVLMQTRRSNQDTGAKTRGARPRSLSPDSFKHNASLSRELLNSMVARSPRHQAALQSYEKAVQDVNSQIAVDRGADAPAVAVKTSRRRRPRRSDIGRSASAMELSSPSELLHKSTAASPKKHGSQSPVHGHAGMGARSPERALSVAMGAQERAEELMKETSIPPLVSPNKSRAQRVAKAKRVLDLKSQAFGFIKDSSGHAWNLTGTPFPLAIPSEVPLHEIENPIFCPHVGIARQPARRIVEKKEPVPMDEKGMKLSDDEIQMLMEYYFPSVEERLKKHNLENEPVIEKYKEERPHQVRGGHRSPSADHFWTPNSVALARLQDARNNPHEQDRLRRLAEEEASKGKVHRRSTAAVDHIRQNLKNAFVPTKHSPILAQGGLTREALLACEAAKRKALEEKREKEMLLSMTLEQQMKARADKVKQLHLKEMWLLQMQTMQRRWLAGIVCAASLRYMFAPVHVRRRSTSLARVFFMATRTIQRWLRKVIWKKRQAIYEQIKRVAWRQLLKVRINQKRRHCWVLKEFFGDCKQRGRAIIAMKNFRTKVLLLQRNIRAFLVNRRFRWMMLELQWANFERRRNRGLRKEWRVAWAHMMTEISKVFKMPPARLRRDSNSKSIRWVSQMMDQLIAKMPESIKNIVVVKPEIRQLVLKDVKRDILQAYLKDLKHYQKRVAQIAENKVIKDIVIATFPALLNQDEGSVRSPELQFLMNSDKLPPWPQLVPLLKTDHLEDLIIRAQGIQRDQEAALAQAAAPPVMAEGDDASEHGSDPVERMGSQNFKAYAVSRFESIDEQGQPPSDEEL